MVWIENPVLKGFSIAFKYPAQILRIGGTSSFFPMSVTSSFSNCGKDTWTIQPVKKATAIVPTPTGPPSIQPSKATLTSIPARTTLMLSPVFSTSIIIKLSRGPAPIFGDT